ncbi:MAG: hypothetical protein WBA74_14820 [Cyclobacteriaceae bacterium]
MEEVKDVYLNKPACSDVSPSSPYWVRARMVRKTVTMWLNRSKDVRGNPSLADTDPPFGNTDHPHVSTTR